MSGIEVFVFKSVVVLSLLYISYWLLLRNGTNYSWNRFFLLTSLVAAIVLPFISISIQPASETYSYLLEPISVSAIMPVLGQQVGSISLSILSIIYISGAVFFLLKFLSKLARLYYLYTRFPKSKFNGFTAVLLDEDHAPFTFFNILFISSNDYQNGADDEIIVHEKAHRDLYHSFDVILLEIMTIIQWFNPLIWLMRNSLKSEHEYMADQKVLLKGYDKVRYQKLLFEKSLGISALNLTNNFNYSLLKKRLKMMTKNKSGILTKVKYLLSVPAVFMVFGFISLNISANAQEEPVYVEVDVMAKYKDGGQEGLLKHITTNLKYPESAKKHGVSGKIFVKFNVGKNGKVGDIKVVKTYFKASSSKTNKSKDEVVVVGYDNTENNVSENNEKLMDKAKADLEAEALRVFKSLGDFTPAQKDGKNVITSFVFPVNFELK